MHLLAATPGAIDDGKEPVDLGQTPADVVVISAADTELAALSAARTEMADPPTLRLASMMHLIHPLSVDLHLDTCGTKSRLVIVRCLGGVGYWSYGVEQFAARLRTSGTKLALLPGDDKPDAELRALSSVDDDDYDALWSYLVEGGPQNSANFLTYAQVMLDGGDVPEPARPLLKAGVYWPGAGVSDLAAAQAGWTDGAAIVPIIFYRALVQGAGLNPINRLVKSLSKAGLNPLPIFVASLKDPLSQATLESLFCAAPPSVILNCTSFAVGSPHSGDAAAANPLAAPSANKAVVFQVVLAASSEETWHEGQSGLSSRDIAMNVALPEVDGRVLSRAISFKGEAYFDEETECPIATYRAMGDRVQWVTDLAANWTKLRAKPVQDKKVALVLANYPNKDGRLANGVGLDTPAATVHVLELLREAGYRVTAPEDAKSLMDTLMSGPTNWLTDRADRHGGEFLPLDIYKQHFDALPWDTKQKITDRWGTPQEDPFILATKRPPEGRSEPGFALSIHTFGNTVVALQPARGYNIDPTDTYHSPDLVPPHNYLAFYFYLRHHWGADAIVHMGKHGNLEWLPGKATALSETCWPEITLGPTPHIYPFIVNDPGEGTQAKRRGHRSSAD